MSNNVNPETVEYLEKTFLSKPDEGKEIARLKAELTCTRNALEGLMETWGQKADAYRKYGDGPLAGVIDVCIVELRDALDRAKRIEKEGTNENKHRHNL
jgi:hypothetical protein